MMFDTPQFPAIPQINERLLAHFPDWQPAMKAIDHDRLAYWVYILVNNRPVKSNYVQMPYRIGAFPSEGLRNVGINREALETIDPQIIADSLIEDLSKEGVTIAHYPREVTLVVD